MSKFSTTTNEITCDKCKGEDSAFKRKNGLIVVQPIIFVVWCYTLSLFVKKNIILFNREEFSFLNKNEIKMQKFFFIKTKIGCMLHRILLLYKYKFQRRCGYLSMWLCTIYFSRLCTVGAHDGVI